MNFDNEDNTRFDPTRTYAGTDSAVLDRDFVSRAMNHHQKRDTDSDPLNAATGIVNGLLLGAAFWSLLYFLIRLSGS